MPCASGLSDMSREFFLDNISSLFSFFVDVGAGASFCELVCAQLKIKTNEFFFGLWVQTFLDAYGNGTYQNYVTKKDLKVADILSS